MLKDSQRRPATGYWPQLPEIRNDSDEGSLGQLLAWHPPKDHARACGHIKEDATRPLALVGHGLTLGTQLIAAKQRLSNAVFFSKTSTRTRDGRTCPRWPHFGGPSA